MNSKLEEIYNSSRIKSFLTAMLLFGVVIGLYNGIFNNYLHEILSVDEAERGMIELPREMPGLLLFILMIFLSRFTEIRLIQLALVITSAGLAGYIFLGEIKFFAILFMAMYSTGEHLMMPVRQSVGLHMARSGKEGRAMGLIRSFGNAGQAAGFYIGPLILLAVKGIYSDKKDNFLQYKAIFISGMIILLVALFVTSFIKKNDEKVQRKKLHIDRKFTRYYLLEVFFGARKQVFLTFAPFVLIIVYDAGPELISMLYGIWSVLNIFIGRGCRQAYR